MGQTETGRRDLFPLSSRVVVDNIDILSFCEVGTLFDDQNEEVSSQKAASRHPLSALLVILSKLSVSIPRCLTSQLPAVLLPKQQKLLQAQQENTHTQREHYRIDNKKSTASNSLPFERRSPLAVENK